MTIKELQRRGKSGVSLEILADIVGCTVAEAELIKRLIQEIEKQKGSSNDH